MRQYDDGSVKVEDARNAATNHAADASAESSEAGAANVSPGAPRGARRSVR